MPSPEILRARDPSRGHSLRRCLWGRRWRLVESAIANRIVRPEESHASLNRRVHQFVGQLEGVKLSMISAHVVFRCKDGSRSGSRSPPDFVVHDSTVSIARRICFFRRETAMAEFVTSIREPSTLRRDRIWRRPCFRTALTTRRESESSRPASVQSTRRMPSHWAIAQKAVPDRRVWRRRCLPGVRIGESGMWRAPKSEVYGDLGAQSPVWISRYEDARLSGDRGTVTTVQRIANASVPHRSAHPICNRVDMHGY